MPVNQMARCRHCGDVIGVYEPLVLVDEDGISRVGSCAAEPGLASEPGERYHHHCYMAARAASDRLDGPRE